MTSSASRPITRRTQISIGTPTRPRLGRTTILLICVGVAVAVAAIVAITGF